MEENGGTNCFATATLYGASYCVPTEGAQYTKMVFAVLAQFQALHTERRRAGHAYGTPAAWLVIRERRGDFYHRQFLVAGAVVLGTITSLAWESCSAALITGAMVAASDAGHTLSRVLRT